jgi:hypothetical protein
MHLWQYDGPEYYFTDENRQYLTYDNVPLIHGPFSILDELKALKNALAIGKILNRTVILPKFHFCGKFASCSIIQHLTLRPFETVFPHYREHMFLTHPKVPKYIVE